MFLHITYHIYVSYISYLSHFQKTSKFQQVVSKPLFLLPIEWKEICHTSLFHSLMVKAMIYVRMQTYLKGLDLWEVIEKNDVPLSENPTVAQIKVHKDKKTGKIMLVCKCLTNDYVQDHDSKVSQRNLGIFESRI